MKIVADEDIPLVEHYFGAYGELVLKKGRAIDRQDVLDADILLVRSVTKVNKQLLENTTVKWVATTTSGTDHLELSWLKDHGITWCSAAGFNAAAVAEYVIAVIAALQKENYLNGNKLRAGVIGVGKIGSKVVEKLKLLNFEVIQCDPLRAITEPDFHSTSLEQFADLDLITIHTPLTHDGPYPTYHLLDKKFLQHQKKDCVLLNTSRGSVIHFDDLKLYGEHLLWCLDVWENEPWIDFEVLDLAWIATPHIAGYSVQNKFHGTKIIYDYAIQQAILPVKKIAAIQFPQQEMTLAAVNQHWQDVVLKIYNPLTTTMQMKNTLVENPDAFDALRKNFSERYEFPFVKIKDAILTDADKTLLEKLHIQLSK